MENTERKGIEPSNAIDLKAAINALASVGAELGKKALAFKKFIDDFQIQYGPQIAIFVQNLAEIPGDFLVIQTALAERGWFVLPEMPAGDFRNLRVFVDDEDFEKVDEIMSLWTLGLFNETEDALCKLFPHRETFIREGFGNHRERRYASSMTLLLTQADGICHDSLGEIFFKIKRNTDRPVTSFIIDELGVDEFTRITLHPVLVKSGINASDDQISRGEFPNSPHRHPILHGRATDYATELNSLKIISFVGFMGGIVHQIVEEAKGVAVAT